MKRAYNPKMSRLYEARMLQQRSPSYVPYDNKRSDPPINMMNAEILLNGIMEDLDTILDEWKDESPQSHRLLRPSPEVHAALKQDAAWLRAALGKNWISIIRVNAFKSV